MALPDNLLSRLFPAALASTALAACNEAEPTLSSPFEATGELIAHSGGDAGAEGACVICHGLEGEGDGNLVPRLAGMERGYFLRQMEYFSEGIRHHKQMDWIADHTDWPARQRLSVYYESLAWPEESETVHLTPGACSLAAARLYHEGDPDRGLVSCASCHGAQGLAPGYGIPALAGQPAPYIAQQLRAWRHGERYGNPDAMLLISRLLEEEEIAPLADYIAALPGASAYPALPAACLPERRPDPSNGA